MLVCSIFGLIHWEDTSYVSPHNDTRKVLSIQNAYSVVVCTRFALVISIAIEFFNVIGLYTETLTNSEGVVIFLRKFFGWFV